MPSNAYNGQLDDDVLEFAKSIALGRQISLGQALSELARKGMRTPVGMKRDAETGFWKFDVPASTRQFGLEEVQQALGQEDLESAQYFRKL